MARSMHEEINFLHNEKVSARCRSMPSYHNVEPDLGQMELEGMT
jgi:hypothetical protein